MKIALFIPCYINALYPQVGEASYRLLRSLGLDVDYPLEQTCCGQPMANAGYERDAQPLAERMEELFAGYDYVVGPSASCVSFVREGYPRLVPHADGRPCLASRIYEICEFVHDVVRPERLDASFHHKVSIHNSCHGVRLMGLSTPSELNIPYRSKLRDLLALVEGVEVFEPARVDECCGFGGMFAVEEIPSAFDADAMEDARELDGIDAAVVGGVLGVAENGAVWLPQRARHKALYFAVESLVILLPRDAVVATMQDAVEDPRFDRDFGFGCFMSGPSKTADIEQALVIGAHGPMSVTVVLTGGKEAAR